MKPYYPYLGQMMSGVNGQPTVRYADTGSPQVRRLGVRYERSLRTSLGAGSGVRGPVSLGGRPDSCGEPAVAVTRRDDRRKVTSRLPCEPEMGLARLIGGCHHSSHGAPRWFHPCLSSLRRLPDLNQAPTCTKKWKSWPPRTTSRQPFMRSPYWPGRPPKGRGRTDGPGPTAPANGSQLTAPG